MRLLIAIFAYNEDRTIVEVIQSIPQKIAGVTSIKIIVVDDGSTDHTAVRARESNVEVISHQSRRGLPRVFMTAVERAIRYEADILVHTDGDNQFDQSDITRLIEPILNNTADTVVGNRNVMALSFMPTINRGGNILGSIILNKVLRVTNIDVSCGFRAYSRECFSRLFIFSNHTYTHETLIQLSTQGFRVTSVPVHCKPRSAGESKLIHNIVTHISRSLLTIIRAALYYSPLRFFSALGGVFFIIGILLGLRYLVIYLSTNEPGHLQSLILASVCLILGFLIIIVGLHADLINRNARVSQEILYLLRVRRASTEQDVSPQQATPPIIKD